MLLQASLGFPFKHCNVPVATLGPCGKVTTQVIQAGVLAFKGAFVARNTQPPPPPPHFPAGSDRTWTACVADMDSWTCLKKTYIYIYKQQEWLGKMGCFVFPPILEVDLPAQHLLRDLCCCAGGLGSLGQRLGFKRRTKKSLLTSDWPK